MTSIIKPPKTISEQVLEALEEEILSGFYQPGDRMVETEIAGHLGVSRGPVREALLVLERRGLIQEKDGIAKGREVVSLKEQDLRQFYQVRIFIESQGLITHARNRDDKVLGRLEEMTREMEPMVQRGDPEAYREANTAWHYFIVSSLNNPRLYDFYLDNDRIIRWFAGFTLAPTRLASSNQEHRTVLEACRRQDIIAINEGLFTHQMQALERVLQKIKKASPKN
ncbi:MAG: GntR family transcriptional regulator [Desulfarculaceae bacterium]|nr:GntR family transcriptional regulator [Desulfarculaceae bacterium]MCF8049169.1 GntR family transcriptional regulator [Desulfarculaceae bacterium]MCF8065424.1 GntR family transcriptional regulator [Desulfarculaceae bacterium]MCF8096703.1 GntR family transcriptional regulator [Desulfarculaceae bacterium]